jgi:bifunctional UDP-N-acetylglucosamine pyrophosphorylase / glucosamine-1-phosphate N-acetyltransferase
MSCESIILAAGLGTRMRSPRAKMLHTLAGKPMLAWVAEACRQATDRVPTIVIGPDQDGVKASVAEAVWVVQDERLGTGHAVRQAAPTLTDHHGDVLIANGDLPLLTANTMRQLIAAHQSGRHVLTLLTVVAQDPRGFGRILRNAHGEPTSIVEEAQATPEQLASRELNAGLYCVRADWLWDHLEHIPRSPKGEYYLTDLVELAVGEGNPVGWIEVADAREAVGINTQAHLAEAEAILRQRINRRWMEFGVTLQDPSTAYIDAQAELSPGAMILANTHIQGASRIGPGTCLGPNAVVRDTVIGSDCLIIASILEEAEVGDRVEIGPFGHLRSGARLQDDVHMGNFGEVKNSTLGPGVKMGHFSYLGDAEVGAETNIGAGTITCNFDGQRKNPTHIGHDAFIGSDTMLVAPVRIGDGARTGAGSVVTKDVADHSLAVGMPARVVRRLEDDDR